MNNEEEEKIIDETESVFANKRNRFSDEAFKNGDEEEEVGEVPAEDVFTDEDFAGGFQEPENQDGESDVGEIN